jgi:hypothetical protein
MAGLVTVAISPHKSSCNGSTFWLPAVEHERVLRRESEQMVLSVVSWSLSTYEDQ